jgi:hypothetical protein
MFHAKFAKQTEKGFCGRKRDSMNFDLILSHYHDSVGKFWRELGSKIVLAVFSELALQKINDGLPSNGCCFTNSSRLGLKHS